MKHPIRCWAALFAAVACTGDRLPSDPTAIEAVLLAPSTPSVTIARGGTDSVYVAVTRVNYTGAVVLGLNPPPAGVSVTFDPATVPNTGTQSTMRLNVAANSPTGSHTLLLRGAFGAKTATTNVIIVITGGD